jgi:hypothetical protein
MSVPPYASNASTYRRVPACSLIAVKADLRLQAPRPIWSSSEWWRAAGSAGKDLVISFVKSTRGLRFAGRQEVKSTSPA